MQRLITQWVNITLWLLITIPALPLSILNAEEPIKLAITHYPPYEYRTSDGEIEGLNVDLVVEAFKRMNQPISITELPWSRALVYLEKGQIDGLIDMLKVKKREEFTLYSNLPIIELTSSIFFLEGSDVPFTGDLESLGHLKFGVIRGYHYGPEFELALRYGAISKMQPQTSITNLFKSLCNEKIDIMLGNRIGVQHTYSKIANSSSNFIQKRCKKIIRHPIDLNTVPAYVGFSKIKNLGALRNQFDNALLEMKQDGTYQNIFNSWRDRIERDGNNIEILKKTSSKQ